MSDSTLRTHKSIYDSTKETSELITESKEDIRRFAHNIIDIRVTKRIGNRPLYAHTILEALLEHAPTLQGQRYVASAILAQENDPARLTELSRVWLNRLLSPGTGFTSMLLERHGYKCAISLLTYDKSTPSSIAVPEKFVSRKLHAVHIIPLYLSRDGGFDSKVGGRLKIFALVATLIVMVLLEGRHQQVGHAGGLGGYQSSNTQWRENQDLSNLILMSTEVHEDFGNFTFWFEPTDQLHTYTVHLEERQIRFQWASTVAFSNQSDRKLPLPSPEFLAAHAALAKVFRVTGAGDYIDCLWMDAEESGGLSADGSSDVGVLLSSLQRSWHRST
ncbi:hypothetical protein FRC00_008070 [Tulasnella sp. 408]|nr:hypothetical protein FRC00_008070 [Tulasnella sp. 408]